MMTKCPHFNRTFDLFYPAPQAPIHTLKIMIRADGKARLFSAVETARGIDLEFPSTLREICPHPVKAGGSELRLPKIEGIT